VKFEAVRFLGVGDVEAMHDLGLEALAELFAAAMGGPAPSRSRYR
jgi:hypothetical protein